MSQIKKFVDKVASAEARQSRELLIPITDAKEMRDEIMVLLLDQRGQPNNKNEDVTIVMNGGKW